MITGVRSIDQTPQPLLVKLVSDGSMSTIVRWPPIVDTYLVILDISQAQWVEAEVVR